MMRIYADGRNVIHGKRVLRRTASELEAKLQVARIHAGLRIERQKAEAPGEDDPGSLAAAVDAALDAACALIDENDATNLPGWVVQLLGLVVAADTAVDELLIALGVPDPDEDDPEMADDNPPNLVIPTIPMKIPKGVPVPIPNPMAGH